jgi:hypothetical protein
MGQCSRNIAAAALAIDEAAVLRAWDFHRKLR